MAHLLDSHRLTHVKILVKQCQLLGSYNGGIVCVFCCLTTDAEVSIQPCLDEKVFRIS